MRLRKNRRTKWTEEERQKLKSLFGKFDGDIDKISKELRRGERSVRMNLFFMDLIKESEVTKDFKSEAETMIVMSAMNKKRSYIDIDMTTRQTGCLFLTVSQ